MDSLIYIERDATEAILSHHRDTIEAQIDYESVVGTWKSLRDYYSTFGGPKIKIDFQEITGESVDWIIKLGNFFGEQIEPKDAEIIKSRIGLTKRILARPPNASSDYAGRFSERAHKISKTLDEFES